MFCPKHILLISLCLLLRLHGTVCSNPLAHFCFSQGRYIVKSPYYFNLKFLLNSLSNTTSPTGFALSSNGEGQYRVNGLALCRGDVSAEDCKTCVAEASLQIRLLCHADMGAAIWYDYCLLKYSNLEFFGEIDNQHRFSMWNNVQEVCKPVEFDAKVKYLLSEVSSKAYASPKLYATGELELEASQKLYGLAQCTRDLSSANCQSCLDEAISELPNCCNPKRGGRIVGGSCNFRYELYPFVNA